MARYLCILAVVLLASQVEATNYYVTKAGNDANTGLDTSNAFLTIDRGTDSANASGDTLWIGATSGDKWNEQNVWTGGGDRRATIVCKFDGITFKSYIAGSFTDRAIITGFNSSFGDSMFNQGCANIGFDNITIDSIVFDSCGLAGIYTYASSTVGNDSMIIKDCVMKNIHELTTGFSEVNTGGIYFNSATGDGLGGANAARVPDNFPANYGWVIRRDSVYNMMAFAPEIPAYVVADHDNVNSIHGRGLRSGVIDSCFFAGAFYGLRLKTDCDSNIIEYNEFTDFPINAIYHIGNESKKNIFRFNWGYNVYRIHDGRSAISSGAVQDSAHSNAVYNNTVSLIGTGGEGGSYGIGPGIYTRGDGDSTTTGCSVDGYWANNIVYNFSSGNGVAYDYKHAAQQLWDYNCYFNATPGETMAAVHTLSASDPFTLAQWRIFSDTGLAIGPTGDDSADGNSVNLDPAFLSESDSSLATFLRLDTASSPAATLTGGAGSASDTIFDGTVLPTYMGAFDPYPAAAAETTKSQITGSVLVSGSATIGD